VVEEHGKTAPYPIPEWARVAREMPNGSQYLDVDGCRVHYLSWGDPGLPPLMLVHGNAAHAEWWRFVAPLLANQYHVLAIDLGGMGDSGHCGRYERERYAGQVMAVLDAVSPGRPPFIVGHSLGGFVTLMAGAAHGDRLAGIIVIDSPIEPPGKHSPPYAVQVKTPGDVYADRAEALRRFRLVPQQQVGCRFYLDNIAHLSVVETTGGWRWKFDPAAVGYPRPTEFAQALLDMRCSAALFIGEHSERVDPAARAYMHETFAPRIPVVELPNCRHHVMLDEPLALVVALRTQLSNWSLKKTGPRNDA
jgi:pimeloyl-ACP methyl ester carboxylesterase